MTLLGVDWATRGIGGRPRDGRKLVSVLVRYDATGGSDYSATEDWRLSDRSGGRADHIQPSRDPQLGGGSLEAGQSVQGWLTYEVATDATFLSVANRDGLFGGEHEWTVAYDPSASPMPIPPPPSPVAASPAPAATPTPELAPTPRPTPGPTRQPKPTPVPGAGDSVVGNGLKVTLRRVEWNTRSRFIKPDAGKQWVSIQVTYAARAAGDFNSSEDWDVYDQDGERGEKVLFTPKDPELTDGRIRKGKSVSGWITYEFAEGVSRVRVEHHDGLFGDAHEWAVRRPR